MLIKNRFKEQYSLKQNIKYHFRRFKYGITLYIKALIEPENELNLCRYEAFLVESDLFLERGQHNEVEDVWDLNISNGQYGKGIYAYKSGDSKMRKYYTKNNEKIIKFSVPSEFVMDLSDKKLDYWEAKTIIYNNPDYKVFIFSHRGPGIPTSKEYLITDPNIITILN